MPAPASTIAVIAPLWSELFDENFDVDRFAQRILRELGHDGHRLSSKDIINALHFRKRCPWYDIGWGCRESFSGFYRSRAEATDSFVVYVAIACLWADAIAYKELEWDGSFDEILRFTRVNINTGSYCFRIRWFKYMFRAI